MSNLIQKFRDFRYDIFYRLLTRHGYQLTSLGDAGGCEWTICPTGLDARSIVYSGGVGNDISFEHSLVKEFGCTIVLFDPSPTGVQTMARAENQISHFRFHPLALAKDCGHLKFAPPTNPEEGSWFAQKDVPATIEVPCINLDTAMKQNGHDHIDLLKLDIEGSEYEVIADFLERGLPVRQLCVEFHHGILPGIRRSQSIQIMLKLRSRGYQLVNHGGSNHTYLWDRGPVRPHGRLGDGE